jgi:DNA-binding transcriptional ArsR family regulator
MEDVLWYVLASSRGGPTRAQILRAIDERPRNANQLAEAIGMDYTTIRHHLDVLMENNVVRKTDDDYAAVYLFTDQVETHRETLDEVLDAVEPREENE